MRTRKTVTSDVLTTVFVGRGGGRGGGGKGGRGVTNTYIEER